MNEENKVMEAPETEAELKENAAETAEDMPEEKPAEEPAAEESRPEEEKKPEKNFKDSFLYQVLLFARDMAICWVCVLLMVKFVLKPVQVVGSSMYPTLHDQAVGFSNQLGFNMSGAERFDVVIIYLEERNEYLVKRLIGLPGETVAYKDGQLLINGETVDEEFLDGEYVKTYEEEEGRLFTEDFGTVTLGENEYWCMGDNRPHSTDSRVYGAFDSSQVVCKGIFILWPLNQFGGVTW